MQKEEIFCQYSGNAFGLIQLSYRKQAGKLTSFLITCYIHVASREKVLYSGGSRGGALILG